MKDMKTVTRDVKVTTWYCDLCEVEGMHQPPIPKGQHSICDHCGKDLCLEHRKVFTKTIEWSRGFQMHTGPSIVIILCDECRAKTVTYGEAVDLFLKKMKLLHSFPV